MGDEGDFFHKNQIDPYIYKIIGDPKGKTIYDLGCGNGYMSRHFAQNGAAVYASDESSKLIDEAKSKSEGLSIHYSTHDATDFSQYKDGQFDAVVMNMVIHYIKNLDLLFEGISKILKPKGVFAFSTNHFFRPDYPYSLWETGKIGDEERLFIKTTGYLQEEQREIISGWDKQTKMVIYNRPMKTFINTMAKYNLYIFEIHEPYSEGFAKDFSEELQKSHYIPTFIIIGAKKFAYSIDEKDLNKKLKEGATKRAKRDVHLTLD